MSNKHKTFDVPVYTAPDCDACTLLAGALICQSATTEDWVVDENGF